MVPKMDVMASKIRTKMVNLREIKKDHTLLRNDFFKADPFLSVNVKSGEGLLC
jgi:hypothetical protein